MHLIFALAVAENYFEITAAKLLHNLTANAARIAKVLVFAVFVFTDYRNSFEIVFALADCLKKKLFARHISWVKKPNFRYCTPYKLFRLR